MWQKSVLRKIFGKSPATIVGVATTATRLHGCEWLDSYVTEFSQNQTDSGRQKIFLSASSSHQGNSGIHEHAICIPTRNRAIEWHEQKTSHLWSGKAQVRSEVGPIVCIETWRPAVTCDTNLPSRMKVPTIHAANRKMFEGFGNVPLIAVFSEAMLGYLWWRHSRRTLFQRDCYDESKRGLFTPCLVVRKEEQSTLNGETLAVWSDAQHTALIRLNSLVLESKTQAFFVWSVYWTQRLPFKFITKFWKMLFPWDTLLSTSTTSPHPNVEWSLCNERRRTTFWNHKLIDHWSLCSETVHSSCLLFSTHGALNLIDWD